MACAGPCATIGAAGQVSIRIRIDVGAMHEKPQEAGFAHLIEHLVFRQSRYLPQAAAIPPGAPWRDLWQRHQCRNDANGHDLRSTCPMHHRQRWMKASS
jgi:predicted Zn-dependent peptidase